MWNVTLEYTATHFNVLRKTKLDGRTRSDARHVLVYIQWHAAVRNTLLLNCSEHILLALGGGGEESVPLDVEKPRVMGY